MFEDASKTVLLICDVWDNHYCKDLRQRTESLVGRINEFAKVVRSRGGSVLHCPSETVDKFYADWPQRTKMQRYPKTKTIVSEEMRSARIPLDTTLTTGCPDIPQCSVHTNYTRQHGSIEILPQDLISDSGQEIHDFIAHKNIDCVLMAGTALNMCVLSRSFGVEALVEWGIPVRVMSDLVEVFYSPADFPHITAEQAKWFALGYINAEWCPVTNCLRETQDFPEERNMQIHSNLPGSIMARLRRKFQLKFFVETGTAGGDTTEMAASSFNHVWTCDIDGRLVARAKKRLQDYNNVTVSMESSPSFLRVIKPALILPTMYWLDAHWCGGPTKPKKECPLIEELQAIGSFHPQGAVAKQRGYHSVIIIDDANLLESPPPPPHDPKQWPTLGDVQNALNNWGEPYDLDWHEGINSKLLIVTPEVEP